MKTQRVVSISVAALLGSIGTSASALFAGGYAYFVFRVHHNPIACHFFHGARWAHLTLSVLEGATLFTSGSILSLGGAYLILFAPVGQKGKFPRQKEPCLQFLPLDYQEGEKGGWKKASVRCPPALLPAGGACPALKASSLPVWYFIRDGVLSQGIDNALAEKLRGGEAALPGYRTLVFHN